MMARTWRSGPGRPGATGYAPARSTKGNASGCPATGKPARRCRKGRKRRLHRPESPQANDPKPARGWLGEYAWRLHCWAASHTSAIRGRCAVLNKANGALDILPSLRNQGIKDRPDVQQALPGDKRHLDSRFLRPSSDLIGIVSQALSFIHRHHQGRQAVIITKHW